MNGSRVILKEVSKNGIDAGLAEFVRSLSQFTKREREVLILFLEHFSEKKVARQLGTSARTVRNQIVSIMRKMAVKSRVELIFVLLVTFARGL